MSPPPVVAIYFCETCMFRPPAERVAAELREALGITPTLHHAFWGTFRVVVDGREVFNRWKTCGWWGKLGCGRLPQPGEISQLIQQLRSEQ